MSKVDSYSEKYYSLQECSKNNVKQVYPKEIIEIVKALPKNANILDSGGGIGNFCKFVHDIRPDINLNIIDIGDLIEKVPSYVKFYQASVYECPFDDGSFDLVFSSHVLEHLYDPVKFMKEAYRLIRPKGLIFIIVPYYKTMFAPDGPSNFFWDYTHIRLYSIMSIKRLLFDYSFINIKVKLSDRNMRSLLIAPWLLIKYIFLSDKSAGTTLFLAIFGSEVIGIGQKQ